MKELTFSQKALEISYKVRWLMLALIMLGLQFFPADIKDVYLFLSISVIYNITTRLLNLSQLFERTKNICYGETAMDTLVLTGIVSFTGGANSPFWPFFIIVIMFSAAYYSPGMTFLVTLGISLIYIFISILMHPNFHDIISLLSLKIPILFAVCGLSVFFALEIRTHGEELEIEKERVRYLLKAFHNNVVAIQKKNKVLSEIYNISLKPQVDLNISSQVTNICNAASQFLNTDIAGIWLIQKDREALKLTSEPKNILAFKEKIKIGEGIIGRIALAKEPLIINELSKYEPLEFKDGPSSCIAVPLVVDSELLGVFLCASSHPKEFNEEDHLKFLTLIACRTSLSIKNTYLKEEIERMTITDELTGLYNYRYFIETLKKEIRKTERLSGNLSLLMIDIDNFKEFNEKYGHHIGNQMLSLLSLHLTSCLRGNDFLARFGEEEFVIILPEANKEEGIMVGERIRKGIEGAVFIENTEPITVSIGIASFPQDGNKFDELLLCADKAMMIAKEKGKNKTIGFRRKA